MTMQTRTPNHIVMLLANAYKPDPRVQREAIGLTKAGHHVTIICWDRRAELPARETVDGVEIIRVHDVQSAYGSGWRQIFYTPRFWQHAIRLAVDLRPDIVHCHDLDTLYAGRQIKKRLDCPLIYDAHEHYPALMSLYLPQMMVSGLVQWERWLMRNVDATITASTILGDEFTNRGVTPVLTLGNYPDIADYLNVEPTRVQEIRTASRTQSDKLLVGYVASFPHNRQILPFIQAATLLPDVQCHVWGDGLQREQVAAAVAQHENARYHGWVHPDDLPVVFSAVDVIYYCLRLDYPGAVYNAPNTLAQAMAAGKPIIANDVGDLGRIVRTTDCGLLIDEATPDAIAAAIGQLQDEAVRTRLGANGRRAAIETYNSSHLNRQLCELYETLL